MCGDSLRFVRDLAEGVVNGGAADGGAAAAIGAHSELHGPGVPMHDLDILHRNAQLVRDQLRECRLVALSAGV